MGILAQWLVYTVAVVITSYLLPGVVLAGLFSALFTALVLGLANVYIRPFLILLTLPITILTLGLFTFIINAFLILFVDIIVPGFIVEGFWWALLFSIVITIVGSILNNVAKEVVETS
ncbi:MAG: phage holin family protein [bacterium]|nr:phage holin family protein [Candidatus Wildermuthbacteria bacterium]MDP2664803.1 phage holin family protein [bacterium]